jgi:hypothetical protein
VISEVLQLDVSQSGAVAVTVVVPELTQSTEPTPQAPVVEIVNRYVSPEGHPRFLGWFLAMLFVVFSIWITYSTGSRISDRRSSLRWALGIALGGLLAYNYLALGLFGITNWLIASGMSGVLAFVFLGEIVGLIAGWVWSRQ